VVTNSPDSEYHHIDEDASNTVFANLIPVGSTFNSPILRDTRQRFKKSRDAVLPADLDPAALTLRANLHFAQWNVARAYGCARLAYFIAKNHLGMDAESRVGYSCSAMYFARHSVNFDLILDILKRDFMPMANSRVSSQMRTVMLQELAGIHSDVGQQEKAFRLFQLIPDASGNLLLQLNAERHAALLRRKATSIIATHGATGTSNSLLQDARESNPFSENLTASIANTQAWERLSEQDYTGAMDVLEPLHERYIRKIFSANNFIQPIAITAWNAAELLHSYAIAAAHLDKKHRRTSNAALDRAARIYTRCGTCPFELRAGFWDRERPIHHEAWQRGVGQFSLMQPLPGVIELLIDEIAGKLTTQ
jgi:hypothetical protein